MSLGQDCLSANQWQIRECLIFYYYLYNYTLQLYPTTREKDSLEKVPVKLASLLAQFCGHSKYCKCDVIKTSALIQIWKRHKPYMPSAVY